MKKIILRILPISLSSRPTPVLRDNSFSLQYIHYSGCYFGEYKKQAWVFVGEITSVPKKENESGILVLILFPSLKLTAHLLADEMPPPLKRSASIESTQSEKEFSKKYQAITHRMVHRKSSAIMYSRILDRSFGKFTLPCQLHSNCKIVGLIG